MASVLGAVALAFAVAAQATIVLQARPGPGPAHTVRLDLVSLDRLEAVLELDATLTFAPFGLKLLGVEYPASFSPAVPPPNIYPLLDSNPPPAPSAFATPSYLFADEGVNVDPSELFSWLFEVPSGTQGPFAFAVELLVWPPSDDVDRVVLSARTSFTPVPEPGTGTLLAAAGLSWLLRPRRRSPSGSGRRAWIVPIDREAGRRTGRA